VTEDLAALLREVAACRVCADRLPLGPRPVLHVSATARLLIASQAPGTRVHEAGISFWDASGDRLRRWLEMDEAMFYDAARVAILPMGMCYPGRLPNGGDAPPRPECAPLWRARLLAAMPAVRLTLLVGSYAQAWALGPGRVGDRVRDWRDHLARGLFPLPHPSWRTGAWEAANPWFGESVLPALRAAVAEALGDVPRGETGHQKKKGGPEGPPSLGRKRPGRCDVHRPGLV
jgi:uracil-DNA glycosylase